MKEEVTKEWIKKAEADIRTASRESKISDEPNYDIVCYLAQQCAEKYLKAYLVSKEIDPRRTHNLVLLLEDCLKFDIAFEEIREACSLVSGADQYRYPLDNATEEEAKIAMEHSIAIREFVKIKIGIQLF